MKEKKTKKQMVIFAESLIRGIDNSMVAMDKHNSIIKGKTVQLRDVLTGLSNVETPVVELKSNKISTVKSKFPILKKSFNKSETIASVNRPTIKEAIKEIIISSGPKSKTALYNEVTVKYGKWSKQSFYNALKDQNLFKEEEGTITIVKCTASRTSDEEAKNFVEKVVSDQTVATTV